VVALLTMEVNKTVPKRRGKHVTIALGQFSVIIGYGLAQVLGKDPASQVIASDLDADALERVLVRQAPQVAVFDESIMTDPNGLTRSLRVAQPSTGIVALVTRPTQVYCAQLLSSGVSACLSIYASAPEVYAAVRAAAAGGQIHADMSTSTLRHSGSNSLTRREREVLQLLSIGASNAEIAHQLNIAVETARTHVKHIFAKLGISVRQELIGMAIPPRFR
jgi:DNA-binding NarL/FixJ family response regulator